MKFVAITACPTGIAHSQMAAENLETTATDRGHDIHVEVQGAMGTENEIPDDVLAAADAVIVAADTGVQLDRFADHIVVKASVKDGVNDAGGLIDEAVRRVEETGGASDDAAAGDAADDIDDASAADVDDDVADVDNAAADDVAADETASESDKSDASTSSGGLIASIRNLFS